MLGLDDYGSDSEQESTPQAIPKPAPAAKKVKKKITLDLPKQDRLEDAEEPRPAKRPRLEPGEHRSSLLSMLPAPKQQIQTAPLAQPTVERVLGDGQGPGLSFRTSRLASSSSPGNPTSVPASSSLNNPQVRREEVGPSKPPGQGPDFFSLGSSGTHSTASNLKTKASSISSAPAVPSFQIPEPTPTDEYPGYYKLPSGQWAAHDPEYYQSFYKKWKAEYDAHVRALEKGTARGFEQMDKSGMSEVDAQAEMEKAKREFKEREERKAVSKVPEGAAEQPRMKITASKQSGIARTRHQLATMLMDAYANREALEEKIAEGKRNRKEAGNKYGF